MISESDLEYLSECKDVIEHFVALGKLKCWQWINGNGEILDLRKTKVLPLLLNIRDWMWKNSYRATPYCDTIQFAYINKKIERREKVETTAKQILKQGLGGKKW